MSDSQPPGPENDAGQRHEGGAEDSFGPPPGQVFNPQPYGSYPAPPSYPSPYGEPGPGVPDGWAAAQAPAPATPGFPTSALVLLVVSLLLALATAVIGIPSAVMAGLAWRINTVDPTKASRRTTAGWIVLAINFAIGTPLLIAFYIWAASRS